MCYLRIPGDNATMQVDNSTVEKLYALKIMLQKSADLHFSSGSYYSLKYPALSKPTIFLANFTTSFIYFTSTNLYNST